MICKTIEHSAVFDLWEYTELFAANCKYGNGENKHNPKVKKVTFNADLELSWEEWETSCMSMSAERKVKVIYFKSLKELYISDVD